MVWIYLQLERMTKGKKCNFECLSVVLTLYSKPAEYMAIEDTYSPVLHRISQAIRRRAVKPDEGIPPPPDVLTKWSQPPAELIDKSMTNLEILIKTSDVKKGNILFNHLPILIILPYRSARHSQSQTQPRSHQTSLRS